MKIITVLIFFLCTLTLSTQVYAQDSFRLSRPTNNYSYNQANYQTSQFAPRSYNAPDYRAVAAMDDSSFRIQLPPRTKSQTLQSGASTDTHLSQIQVQRLAAHDIVLLIDKSGSMVTDIDAGWKGSLPGLLLGELISNSRWNWCAQQIMQMSDQISKAIPAGFSVLLFDTHYQLFPHVNVTQLKNIFANNSPGGNTNLLRPLNAVFDDYFRRQNISKKKVKPLVIGIITDGCPDESSKIRRSLIDLTHSLQDPKEVTIIFFLIGHHDSQGERFVQSLTNLTSSGASFNFIKGIPFAEVQRYGLARTLADNLD